MSDTKSQKDKLLEQLGDLERSLDIPLVPGELDSWLATVTQELDRTERFLRQRVQSEHPQEFQQISGEDPGLFGRIREMELADEENLDRCETLKLKLAKLEPVVETLGADEKRVEKPINDVIKHGLEFVTQVRKQETVLDTWLLEAYERDRGEGD